LRFAGSEASGAAASDGKGEDGVAAGVGKAAAFPEAFAEPRVFFFLAGCCDNTDKIESWPTAITVAATKAKPHARRNEKREDAFGADS
jgi:hypothetical protein